MDQRDTSTKSEGKVETWNNDLEDLIGLLQLMGKLGYIHGELNFILQNCLHHTLLGFRLQNHFGIVLKRKFRTIFERTIHFKTRV